MLDGVEDLTGRYAGPNRRPLLLVAQGVALIVCVVLLVVDGEFTVALPATLIIAGAVTTWRRGSRRVTVLTTTGLGVRFDREPGGRTIAWQDVLEVHERAAWRGAATVRLASGEEIALPGVPDDVARRLRDAVDAARRR